MMQRMIWQIILLLSVSIPAMVTAATPREGSDQALRQAQQLLQKAAAEKAELEKQLAQLHEQLQQTESELKGFRSRTDKLERVNSRAQQRNTELVDRVRADSERMHDMQIRYRKQLSDAQADIQLLQSAVQERNAWIEACHNKNAGLYKVNTELLAAYRDKDAWDALRQHEPLTGIGAVQVETEVENFQFRLEDLRTVKFEPQTPSPIPAQP